MTDEEVHIPALGNSDCTYVLDGYDTDGTPFYQCLTHDRLEISNDAPCGGHNDDSPGPWMATCDVTGCPRGFVSETLDVAEAMLAEHVAERH